MYFGASIHVTSQNPLVLSYQLQSTAQLYHFCRVLPDLLPMDSSHATTALCASHVNVLHNHSIKEYSVQITFPIIKNAIQSGPLGSCPVKIIKHWGEDSDTNMEARQAAMTQKENNTSRRKVERYVMVLPMLSWPFAVFNPALDETISLHNAKVPTVLMHYYDIMEYLA